VKLLRACSKWIQEWKWLSTTNDLRVTCTRHCGFTSFVQPWCKFPASIPTFKDLILTRELFDWRSLKSGVWVISALSSKMFRLNYLTIDETGLHESVSFFLYLCSTLIFIGLVFSNAFHNLGGTFIDEIRIKELFERCSGLLLRFIVSHILLIWEYLHIVLYSLVDVLFRFNDIIYDDKVI